MMPSTTLIGLLVAVLAVVLPQGKQAAALTIVVIEGENAVNIIQQKTAVAPLVEVRDRNDQPVAGAVVTFSVRGGAASFGGGAPTVTVTTNAAGRAASTALSPLANGRFEIQVEASFQGQTAKSTISQTNMMTAAQTATGSIAGGGTAGTGGAAGGAGGGLSVTTLGIIGGAVAGGTVAARALGGGEQTQPQPQGRTYASPYDSQFVMTVTDLDGSRPCTWGTRYAGTLRMTVRDNGGAISGTAEMAGTKSVATPGCGLSAATFFNGVDRFDVGGTASALAFSRQDTFLGDNNVTVTETLSFTGALAQDSITGTLTIARRETAGVRIGIGGGTVAVTLR